MKGEKIILLVKEAEKIKSINSKNSYIGAWFEFLVAVIWLVGLHVTPFIGEFRSTSLTLLSGFVFVIPLGLLFHSCFLIGRHILNKKIALLIDAILELKKED